MIRKYRTDAEWFAEASRCYVEHHQGCAWCGGTYRVFHTHHGDQREYYCHGCDFRVTYNAADECYTSYPGEHRSSGKRSTMPAV